eukprot:scaffold20180_cov116-Isochrysis_galbana.AAC.2
MAERSKPLSGECADGIMGRARTMPEGDGSWPALLDGRIKCLKPGAPRGGRGANVMLAAAGRCAPDVYDAGCGDDSLLSEVAGWPGRS